MRKGVFGESVGKCLRIGAFVRCDTRGWHRRREVNCFFYFEFRHAVSSQCVCWFLRFNVHRNIMMASSPYFNALLGPNYKEAEKKEIKLSKIDGKTLKTIIHFCYTGRVEITNDTVADILAAASSMELVQLGPKN